MIYMTNRTIMDIYNLMIITKYVTFSGFDAFFCEDGYSFTLTKRASGYLVRWKKQAWRWWDVLVADLNCSLQTYLNCDSSKTIA